MKAQLEYLISWAIVISCSIAALAAVILCYSFIHPKYEIWKQKQLARANIERAIGIAKANKIMGEKVINIHYL